MCGLDVPDENRSIVGILGNFNRMFLVNLNSSYLI